MGWFERWTERSANKSWDKIDHCCCVHGNSNKCEKYQCSNRDAWIFCEKHYIKYHVQLVPDRKCPWCHDIEIHDYIKELRTLQPNDKNID